jgi:hypothetical protein
MGQSFIDPRTGGPVDQMHGGANAVLNQGLGCRDCHTVGSGEVFQPQRPGGFNAGSMELLAPQRGGVFDPTPIPPG